MIPARRAAIVAEVAERASEMLREPNTMSIHEASQFIYLTKQHRATNRRIAALAFAALFAAEEEKEKK